MRIAFVVNQFPCLSETFILRQITGLVERGHAVDIFAYGPGSDSIRHADVEEYGLLSHTYYLTQCACAHAAPIRALKRLGLIFTDFHKHPKAVLKALNVARFGTSGLFLQVLCQITPFLSRGPYDILHCQFGHLGELGLLLKDTGVFTGKLITSFRGYDISSYVTLHGDAVYRELFSRGDLFLCVSKHIKDKLIRLGCHERKIIVQRSGVAIKKSQFTLRVAKRSEDITILTIARLNEKKGVEYGIRAVAKVLKNYPCTQYKIAGEGPLRDKLQSLVAEIRGDNNIKLLGWKSQEDIAELLQNSDILLAPSVVSEAGDEEGIPGVIMEAFANGLPVISTYHAGIPEVVHDGNSGFLVPERDVDALSEKIDYLIRNPERRVAMGAKGREFVQKYYDVSKLNSRLVQIYETVLNGNPMHLDDLYSIQKCADI